jgi:RNA polymerase sigma factor (sigma-70 family)
MVLGVCRRVLGNDHDADDAFQAVFLVLIRRAGSVQSPHLLAGWLHGVAVRVAGKARRRGARRRERELQVLPMPERAARPEPGPSDLRLVLDAELARLPERYRAAVALCDLEGHTRKEAARRLACPEGTLSTWLLRGRTLLADRLRRRGVGLAAAGVALGATAGVGTAAIPDTLLRATLRLASEAPAAAVAALTRGTGRTFLLLAALGVAAAALVGAALAAVPVFTGSDPPRTPVAVAPAASPAPGAGGSMRCAALSADGTLLATADDSSSTVTLRNAATGEVRAQLNRHRRGVLALAFSPDGTALATGGRDHKFKLWAVDSRLERVDIADHTGPVTAVTFSGDGQLVASGSTDGTIRVWHALACQQMRILRCGEPVRCLAFSAGGRKLAVGCGDGTVMVWPLKTDQEPVTLRGHAGAVLAVAFASDGATLATAGHDGTVRLWPVAGGAALLTVRAHGGPAHCVAFTPDGAALLTAGEDGAVRVWEAATGRERTTFRGHAAGVCSVGVAKDGRTAFTADRDGVVKRWDLTAVPELPQPQPPPAPKERFALERHGDQVALSPDGKTLATSRGGVLKLWDTTGKELPALKQIDKVFRVRSLAFSADGKLLACCGNDDSYGLWDMTRREQVAQFLDPKNDVYSLAVAFSADSKTLAIGTELDLIRLIDTATGKQTGKIDVKDRDVLALAFLAGGKTLVAVTEGLKCSMPVFDVATGKEIGEFPVGDDSPRTLALSADGKALVSGHASGLVKLWDPVTYKLRLALQGHTSAVECVAVSSDGATVASGGRDKTVKLWDTATGKERASLPQPVRVISVALDADGRALAVGLVNGKAAVWDVGR